MAQTSYSAEQELAFKGMKSDSRFDFVASSMAEAVIDFGVGVKRGTDPEYQVLTIDDAGDAFYGIALYEESQTTGDYQISKPVNIMRQGAPWVYSGVAVNAGDAAYCVPATGDFTNVSTDNVVTGGVFGKTIAAAGLTTIEINLP